MLRLRGRPKGAPNKNYNRLNTNKLENNWLTAYAMTHNEHSACEMNHVTYHTYKKVLAENAEFRSLKEALDVRDIGVTRDMLRKSAHGYDLNNIKEEQELVPDPRFPAKYIPDPLHPGKFIIDPKNPGKMHWVTKKRTLSVNHFPPNSTSLIFKLCNEDKERYKNISHIESKGTVDVTSTERVITSIDDQSIADLAKAIVKAKTSARS